METSSRRVYLIRHGHILVEGPKRYIGQSEHPLSPRGREQVRELAQGFAAIPLAAVASSDAGRCLQTAQAIAQPKGLEVEMWPEFRELDLGGWEGLSFAEVRARFPEEFERRGQDPAGFRPPGGESFGDLLNRAAPAFERLLAASAGDLALVSHAGVIRVLLSHLSGTPLDDLFQYKPAYAGVYVLDFGPNGFAGMRPWAGDGATGD